MEGALLPGRGSLELDQHRLADQRFERDRGIERERRDLDTKAFAQPFGDTHAFSQQYVFAKSGRQLQDTAMLAVTAGQAIHHG